MIDQTSSPEFQPPLPQGQGRRAGVEVDDRRLHQQNRPEKGGVDFRRRRLGGDDRLVRIDRFGGGTNLRQRRPLDAAIDHRRRSDSRQAKANHSGNNERGDPIAAQAQNIIRHFDYSVLVFACGREGARQRQILDLRLLSLLVSDWKLNSAILSIARRYGIAARQRARIRASAIKATIGSDHRVLVLSLEPHVDDLPDLHRHRRRKFPLKRFRQRVVEPREQGKLAQKLHIGA